MQINITFRHLDSSPGLKEYVHKRISKLEKYFYGPVEAHVILKAEKFRQEAEVTLVGDGYNITGKEETSDMYEAIDLVAAKLETQVKKLREKRKSRKRGPSKELEVASPVSLEEEEEPSVEIEKVYLKPMSLEEALEQIKTTQKDFLIFNNPDTASVNVLYRKGNSYVLVLPELS
ncbi:MAG: ribosome-associated translation inhibitor RaiA [Thermodesulfobacteria bacterium]|nr:ribosome-associated translation inhibitor RaiA [Thermodesulfobacteriota bacterium]